MYIDSVFNFTGSKFKILDQIIPFFNKEQEIFFDLFTGGGSVYINVVDYYDTIYVNDIIKELIQIQEKLIISDDIIHKVKKLVVDKDDQEGFLELRKSFNSEKTPEKLWALMLCSTNNMMRFNKKFEYNQTFGKRTFNPSTENKIQKFTEKVRLYKDKLFFSYNSFKNNPILSNTMYYIDPPYGYVKNEDGSIGNKQISEAGYNAYYSKTDDLYLYQYIKDIHRVNSSFMISGLLEHNGKESWLLNKLIKDGFTYKEIDLNYNKVSKKKENKKSKEIIIMNYGNR